jgi:hypothetical protein
MKFLVGDNPFHGISHLSQSRARARSLEQSQKKAEYAAQIVQLSFENGANGFMFSVDKATLSILKILREKTKLKDAELYAIVPYAYEYVRRATQAGGVSGLAKQLSREMIFSSNIGVLALNAGGLLRFSPSSLLKTYVAYEMARLKSATRSKTCLKSVLLHEIITDMALALNLDQLFRSYIKFMKKTGVKPGFETRNFTYLVRRFEEWGIDFNDVVLTSSFNSVGFQMEPSKAECEIALRRVQGAEVIAMSILGAGFLRPPEAVKYLATLDGITGVVVGISRENQAVETFRLLKSELGNSRDYREARIQ